MPSHYAGYARVSAWRRAMSGQDSPCRRWSRDSRILKCFVLIDLKRGEVQHEDIGQMNLYLNYYREEMNTPGDTEPIGIVMGAYEDKLMVKYATQNISNQLFVSRYQLYLPDKDQLENEIRRFIDADAAKEN